jgi:hypothetical protein
MEGVGEGMPWRGVVSSARAALRSGQITDVNSSEVFCAAWPLMCGLAEAAASRRGFLCSAQWQTAHHRKTMQVHDNTLIDVCCAASPCVCLATLLQRLLVQKGLMSLDELRRATEQLPGGVRASAWWDQHTCVEHVLWLTCALICETQL